MSDGMLFASLQPNLNQLELEKFQRMGEIAYEADCRRVAFDWIRANPGRFAIISMKRFFYYWNGVPRPTDSVAPWDFRSSAFLASSVLAIWGLGRALRQKRPGAWLFAGLVATYPTVYYFGVSPRPLPPSYRARVVYPDGVLAFRKFGAAPLVAEELIVD